MPTQQCLSEMGRGWDDEARLLSEEMASCGEMGGACLQMSFLSV